jgi:UDP-N-acetylglucosamine 2-epimerase (non-hydrolysing)/GDP/UDP-N,N'-diacetylbacillosamine 2-epimerase (hydrolysing)
MKEIQADPGLKLQLLVSGSHLASEYGETWRSIEADGFSIDAKVEMKLDSDEAVAVAKSMALGLSGCAEALGQLRPDILVLLGDRYEALAAAEAALLLGIPVAHIHGGEASEGAFDDAMRHAITKLSHLHFTAAEPYRQRVIQMGEAPGRVYNFGSPGLDYISRLKLATRAEFEKETGIKLGALNFLITYHPATLDGKSMGRGAKALLSALEYFPDVHMIFTRANADPGGRLINADIQAWVACNGSRAVCVPSLGQRLYLSAMSLCDAVVGNSSSGIIEAPAIGKPTVNIGQRQDGRERALSIIDCPNDTNAIVGAIIRARSPQMQKIARHCESPYGRGDTSQQIKQILASVKLDGLLMKRFHKAS